MMKRSISMLLLIAMLAGMTACGESGTTNDTTAAGDTTAPVTEEDGIPEPELPEKDYGGATFTFLIRGGNAIGYHDVWVDAEEENGEAVNDAIFKRNLAVEEKFNITIETFSPDGDGWAGEVENTARRYIQSGDTGIDVISNMRSSLGELGVEGYLHNFHDLEYVNLTAEYWDANAVEDMTVLGKLFMMPCDISMGNLSTTRFMYFNKGILEDYKMESPYDLVDANQWTLDKMLEMTTKVSEDLNGDSVFDHRDKYGFLFDDTSNGTISYIAAGVGLQCVTVDPTEVLKANVMNEKVQDVLTKCYEVFESGNYSISSEKLVEVGDASAYSNTYDYGRKLYSDGQFLFYNGNISAMKMFRDMKQDFGVVPTPKYDENQEGYYHKVDKFGLLFGVPVCTEDPERVGIVMEYMAWLSNKTVLPAYYDTTIKAKRLRDDKAVEMLDIIKQSIVYDFNDLYRLGGDDILYEGYKGQSLASNWASMGPAMQEKMKKLIDNFKSLE